MGEEKKDRSDGSRDVRVVEGSRDVRVGVSLAALIRGHRRLRHRRTTLHFFYPDRLYCGRYKTFCFSTLHSCTHCTGAADIVQFYTSSTQVRQSTIALQGSLQEIPLYLYITLLPVTLSKSTQLIIKSKSYRTLHFFFSLTIHYIPVWCAYGNWAYVLSEKITLQG